MLLDICRAAVGMLRPDGFLALETGGVISLPQILCRLHADFTDANVHDRDVVSQWWLQCLHHLLMLTQIVSLNSVRDLNLRFALDRRHTGDGSCSFHVGTL